MVLEETRSKPWCVYIIETHNNTYYTGITNNLQARWHAHLNGKGAKYLRANKPKAIVYIELCQDRSLASVRESTVKSLDRKQKEQLVAQGETNFLKNALEAGLDTVS